MEYLLLWSGDYIGMKKTRIPAVKPKGLLMDVDENGVASAPCDESIKAALPKRLQRAFERSFMTRRTDARAPKDTPYIWRLYDTRARYLITVYAQPLTKG